MKWIDGRGRLGGGPIHLFDLFLLAACVFLLWHFRALGPRVFTTPVKGTVATPVRITESTVGVMIRPKPAVVQDLQLIVRDLDPEAAEKIRVGHKDMADPGTVAEITEVHQAQPATRRVDLGGGHILAYGPADSRLVRVRLRIEAESRENPRLGPNTYLIYKGEPIYEDRLYRFVGPGYVLTGKFASFDDPQEGGYLPERRLLRIRVVSHPLDPEVAEMVQQGDRSISARKFTPPGTYLKVNWVIRNVPSEVPAGAAAPPHGMKPGMRTVEAILECLCAAGPWGYHVDPTASLQVGGELLFQTTTYQFRFVIKGMEAASSPQARASRPKRGPRAIPPNKPDPPMKSAERAPPESG